MTRKPLLIGLMGIALSLAACGFQPVYGPGASVEAGAGAIAITPIEGRLGYETRRELELRLAQGLPGVGPGARLDIALLERSESLRLEVDQSSIRESLRADVRYRLVSAETLMFFVCKRKY